MISWSSETVSETVSRRLESHRDELAGRELRVAVEEVKQEADGWYVPVVSSGGAPENEPVLDDVLNRVEQELEEQDHLYVMLVPAPAGPETSS